MYEICMELKNFASSSVVQAVFHHLWPIVSRGWRSVFLNLGFGNRYLKVDTTYHTYKHWFGISVIGKLNFGSIWFLVMPY